MKTLLRLCAVMVLLCICIHTAQAKVYYTFGSEGGVSYIADYYESDIKELGAIITGSGDITIAETYQGYPVTTFHGSMNDDVESIKFPASIREIKNDISKPDYSNTRECYSLSSCSKLRSIDLSKTGITILPAEQYGGYYYSDSRSYFNPATTDIKLPEGLKEIEGRAFEGNLMEEIHIPETVEKIGHLAFSNCPNLKSITIPASAETIGQGILYNCPLLEELIVADASDAKRIDFNSLFVLNSMEQQDNHIKKLYLGRPIPIYDGEYGIQCFPEIEELTIGKYVKTIPPFLTGSEFDIYCPNLRKLTLNEGVEEIGEQAFANCKNLDSPLILPASLKKLGQEAFVACTKIPSVEILGNITETVLYPHSKLGPFSHCESITSVKLSENVEELPAYIFADCNLSEFIIPPTLKRIGSDALDNNPIKQLTIPATLDSIADVSLYSLEELTIEDSDRPLKGKEFWAKSIYMGRNIEYNPDTYEDLKVRYIRCEKLSIGPKVTALGEFFSVSNCVDVPSLEQWLSFDFDGANSNPTSKCKLLLIGGQSVRHITIPDGTKQIKKCMFCDCEQLLTVTLPSSLESVGSGVFVGCSNLERIIFPSLESLFKVEPENYSTWLRDNRRVSDITQLYPYKIDFYIGETPLSSMTDIVVPESVTHIPGHSFSGEKNLKSIKLPAGLKSIGDYAFSASGLEYTGELPAGVTEIGEGAFQRTQLTNFAIPAGIHDIKPYTFENCMLENFKFHDDIYHVGKYAFAGTHFYNKKKKSEDIVSDMTIVLPANLKQIDESAFCGLDAKLKRLVMPLALDSIGLSSFGISTSCEVEIHNISDWCNVKFYNYSSNPIFAMGSFTIGGIMPSSIVIPEGIEKIELAFAGAKNLRKARIKGNPTIDRGAFWRSSLEQVCMDNPRLTDTDVFPENLKEVYCTSAEPPVVTDDRAFRYYDNRVTVYVPQGALANYETSQPAWYKFPYIKERDMSDIDILFADETGVEDIRIPQRNWTVQTDGGILYVAGAAEGSSMQVFSAGGRMLYNGTTDGSVAVTPGVYMVRMADGTTAKVIAK